jgi:peptidoglycan/LPS O-acetylase OafA/YrhL
MPVHISKIAPLTSLRFFAAAMIVVGHAYPLFGRGAIAEYLPLDQGVSFFFVLSGFVLAYNYPVLPTRADVARFWVARFARVWPLHAVTCLMWIALAFGFDRQTYFPGFEGMARLLVNLLLLQAWVPHKDWTTAFNGVSWTLSVEFFFYALFPLIVAFWARRWQVIVAVQAAIVVLFLIASHALALPASGDYPGPGLQSALFFNPLVRMLEFSAGVGIAFLVPGFERSGATLTKWQWLVLEVFVSSATIVALAAAAAPRGIQNLFGEAVAYYFTREGLWILWAAIVWLFAVSRGPGRRLPVAAGHGLPRRDQLRALPGACHAHPLPDAPLDLAGAARDDGLRRVLDRLPGSFLAALRRRGKAAAPRDCRLVGPARRSRHRGGRAASIPPRGRRRVARGRFGHDPVPGGKRGRPRRQAGCRVRGLAPDHQRARRRRLRIQGGDPGRASRRHRARRSQFVGPPQVRR